MVVGRKLKSASDKTERWSPGYSPELCILAKLEEMYKVLDCIFACDLCKFDHFLGIIFHFGYIFTPFSSPKKLIYFVLFNKHHFP